MTNLEIIQKLREARFTDEDEESYALELEPGLQDAEIATLKQQFPNETIADELLEILKETKGWDGYGPEMVYFDSIGQFGFWELSQNSLTLGHDGFGNYWILDIDKDGNLGKVFFACHDPAVFVIHSQNLNEYLNHLLEFYENPVTCHLNEIHEKTVMTLWDTNSACSPITEFRKKNPAYDDFLSKFEGEEWTVADIRDGQTKSGFAWGRFGPNQFTERHPTDLVWVIKNKKEGFLSRLFGK